MTYKKIKLYEVGGEVYSDMPNSSENPCLHCGGCCQYFRVSFYQGEIKDLGGNVPSEMTKQITPFMVAMKGTEYGKGRCIALNGEVGKNISCAIYENRPSVCRSYHVWDKEGNPNERCQKIRKELGLPLLEKLNIE